MSGIKSRTKTPRDKDWRWQSFASTNPRRAFTLLGAGAVGGLLIAGFGLFTSKGTTVDFVPPEDVALVNQQPILQVDFDAQLQSVYGLTPDKATDAQKRKIVHDMIREEVYVQRGLELGMPESDPDTRNALVSSVEQQVLADITTDSPSDQKLQAYYDSHRGRYASEGSITVTDLLAPAAGAGIEAAEARAKDAATAIQRGMTIGEATAKFALKDTRKTSGEEFYFAARIHLGPALFAAATQLKSGQASAPVKAGDGYHVLVVAQNTPPVAQNFAAAREQVLTDYKNDAEAHLQANEEKFLIDRADILVAGRYKKYLP
ncbi:MAG: peptidyl-prolyl cis-trans isomerase [Pseudomonadota bacterium]